jgi:hypothetical protein
MFQRWKKSLSNLHIQQRVIITVMWSFWVEAKLCMVFLPFVYIWIALDPVIKRGGLGSNKSFNPATFLCLSQARTWISNVICHSLFCVQWVQLKWEVIVRFIDIGGIDNCHCLNFLFIIIREDPTIIFEMFFYQVN